MSYFPFYMDISRKKGLIVGGGRVALHKIEKLLPFGPRLTVVAPDILPQIQGLAECRHREFQETDLVDAMFVIAAADDGTVNARVSQCCRQHAIPVNVVDDKEKCTFIFPSVAKKGALTVAVSTEGASPYVAAMLRRRVEQTLPARTEEILDYLAWLRPIAKNRIPDPEKRSAFLKETAQYCFDGDIVPTAEETDRRISGYI